MSAEKKHHNGAAPGTKPDAAPSVSIDLDNAEMQQAMQLLEHTRHSIFLTGKAGTGKSTFLRYITATTRKKFVVLAPTGIAAVNVGGQTIHSFFRAPFKPVLPDDPDFAVKHLRKRLKYPADLVKLIRSLDLIIIDEISMVRADLIDFIDRVLRVYSGHMRQPFGGKQLLVVGDIFQLEPVATAETRDMLLRFYPGVYFFNARVFREMSLVPIELRKVYRQTDGEFVQLLDSVRAGQLAPGQLAMLNARVQPETEDAMDAPADITRMSMTIAARRATVDDINTRHMQALKTPAVTFDGLIEGDFKLDNLPTDEHLVLKVGAQVVFIKNDQERRWVNGTLGIVEHCTPDKVAVRTEDGVLHVVEPVVWNNVRYVYNETEKTVDEEILGSFTQLPLKAAWALTIHKSQGLTFSKVVIDIGAGAFAGGQTYVALSRCRTLEGISLRTPLSARDVFVKTAVRDFSRSFNDRRLIDSALRESRADWLYARSAKSLSEGKISVAADMFLEAASIRNECGNPGVRRLLGLKVRGVEKMRGRIADLESENASLRAKLESLADEYVSLGNESVENVTEAEAAVRNFDRALDLCPGHYGALMGKSRLAFNQGYTDAAYKAASEACAVAPERIEPLLMIADIAAQTDPADAYDALLKAESLDSENVSVLGRMVELCESLGMDEEAAHYRRRHEAALRKRRPPRGSRKK